MNVTVFSTRRYEREPLAEANKSAGHELRFREEGLSDATAGLAAGSDAVSIFVGDRADRAALTRLHAAGVRMLSLRSAGFNHVDLRAARDLGLAVARVPAYSPHAVAEHAVALLLTLNRKTHRAFNRVREQNFSLDGLMGFDLHGKSVGVIGTGRIGEQFARIMIGFGCRVLASDPQPSRELIETGVRYVSLDEVWPVCDVVSLHCPLTPETRHMINADVYASMKTGVVLLNTSRGGVIDSLATIDALKSGKVGALGIDVYEEEESLFFRDLSAEPIKDDVFVRLLTFPNVLVTGHQGFFTMEALRNIAETTLGNITAFASGGIDPANRLVPLVRSGA